MHVRPPSIMISSLYGLLCLAVTCNAAEELPLIPRKALFSKHTLANVRLSPDGTKYSYISVEGDAPSAWVVPIESANNKKHIGKEVPGKTHDCFWSADGTCLILWQEVERGVGHLIRIDLDSEKYLDLTPIPKSICRFAGVSTGVPDEILFTTDDRDPEVNELWRVNIDSGERTLVQDATGFINVHVDGKFIPRVAEKLIGSKGSHKIELLALDPDGGQRPLCTLSYDELGFYEGSEPVIGVNSEGSRCYVVDRSKRDKSALFEVEISTAAKKLLVEDADADIAMNTSDETFSVSNSYSNQLMAVSAFFDRETQYALSAETQRDFAFLTEHFGVPVGVRSTSADGTAWIVFPLDGGPRQFHLYNSNSKKVSYLLSQYSELNEYRLAKRSMHVVPTRDGLRLPCHLYLPPDADKDGDGIPDSPLPMMMWVHGGPSVFYSWDDWSTNRHLQLLADRGYASLRVEFRGTDGLGRKVRNMGYRQWGNKAQSDLIDIAEWAIEQGIAQKGEVGAWGWSYGGYATNALATITPYQLKCGISMYGVSSLEALLRQSGEEDTTNWWRRVLGDERTSEGRASLERGSPILHAAKSHMPLLVTCGGKDVLVPHDVQSEPFARRLLELGKPVSYLYYPDEPHDYRQDENWISFWAIGEHFLSKHLGGRCEPYQDDLMSGSLEIKFGAERIPGLVKAAEKVGSADSPG